MLQCSVYVYHCVKAELHTLRLDLRSYKEKRKFTMKHLNPSLAAQLRALPISESDLIEALHWMEKGEALADMLIGFTRLFRRAPALTPATN